MHYTCWQLNYLFLGQISFLILHLYNCLFGTSTWRSRRHLTLDMSALELLTFPSYPQMALLSFRLYRPNHWHTPCSSPSCTTHIQSIMKAWPYHPMHPEPDHSYLLLLYHAAEPPFLWIILSLPASTLPHYSLFWILQPQWSFQNLFQIVLLLCSNPCIVPHLLSAVKVLAVARQALCNLVSVPSLISSPPTLPFTHSSATLGSLPGLEHTGTLDLRPFHSLPLSFLLFWPPSHIGIARSLAYFGEFCSNALSMLPLSQSTHFLAPICLILLAFFIFALMLNL